jgi:3D (Asp-Asp-Asp) domain-containing protein
MRRLLLLGVLALAGGWLGARALDEAVRDRAGGPRGATVEAAAAPPATAAAREPAAGPADPEPAAAAEPADPDHLGSFRLTRYYVADESGFARPRHHDDAVLAAGNGAAAVTLYDDRGCRALATVGRRFAQVLDVQGTGRLRDGRVLNVSRSCPCPRSPCYRPMRADARWGLGATSLPLEPFRSVAVDPKVIPLGSTLYLPELDGLTMPGQAPWGGFVHDGCVVATDVGGGVAGHHVDLFVGRLAYKRALDARRRIKQVTVHRGEGYCDGRRRGSARAGT